MENQNDFQRERDIHFTYNPSPDMTSLLQGDVLKKTDDLTSILREVHPYFTNEEYKYFIVLSQSCDLVRRNGHNCKTPYITIAAVRGYNDFLERTLTARRFAENYNGFLLVEERNKQQVVELVERVYNNTEPDYFFLYKEDALGFPRSMVAYLKVSIALKSERHYQKLLEAKVLELSAQFQAKLGWLVGNMYSRVGTIDWESIVSSTVKKQMIEDDINARCIIGAKEKIKELKKKLDEGDLETIDKAVEFLSSIIVKNKYEELMDIIEEIVRTGPRSISEKDREILLRTFRSRQRIKQLV